MEQCDATIVNVEHLTIDIVRLTLQVPPSVVSCAKPGQFVNLKAGPGFDPLLRRPFSIHRIQGEDTLQVVFKIIGKGTNALANLHGGQSVSVVGPLGNHFVLGESMCLIGGGLGIAPLVFLAHTILEKKTTINLKVILGARNRDELACFSKEFDALGIETHLATDDGSHGHQGVVTDLMAETLGNKEDWQICCCGPHMMMKSVASICRRHGWSCQVSLETMMACGISACLGCAVEASPTNNKAKSGQYLHVCQDGPIFFEGDIKWNR